MRGAKSGRRGYGGTHAADPQSVSFAGDPHFFHHARVFGELIACHGAQPFGRAAAHREAQILQPIALLDLGNVLGTN
jgi:hypothetical protein